MPTTIGLFKVIEPLSNAGDKVLKVFEKLKKKEVEIAKPVPTSTSMDVGVEPIGTQEMHDILKKDYGFDWEKSKGLDIDEYRAGG